MADTFDLEQIGKKLANEGPFRVEQTPRRVRGLFNGRYAFDTIEAYHVWEHPYYPQFYIPISSFTDDATLVKTSAIDGTKGSAHFARLSVGDKSTDRVIIFETPQLKDVAKIEFKAIDQWFEEDVRIFQHPKDPYKRIDILRSTRSVKIAIDGTTLAESSNPLLLLETSLPTRYYLLPTSVHWEYLAESSTETYCPYKGKANYYNVKVNGNEYKDVVWYYIYPTAESFLIAGHLCFYNEKVDVWVDGKLQQK